MTELARKIVRDTVSDQRTNESIEFIWKRLPSKLRSKVDIVKLKEFVTAIDDGMTLARAALAADIPLALATGIMNSVRVIL